MKKESAIEHFRASLKGRQKSPATIEQYLAYAERFLDFCDGKHFASAEDAIPEFLSSLTPCSVATQKGALSALAGRNGFYAVHGREIGQLPQWVFAKRPVRIPTWVTQSEAESIIAQLPDPWCIMAGLMFGSGLRIGETVELRWRAFDFERGTVSIWSGKGDKCRIAPLSRRLLEPLMARRERCRGLWEEDRANRRPGVAPVEQLSRKYPSHGVEWPFFWVFPSAKESCDPESGIIRRHHIHDKSFAKALRPAARRAKIDKRVTAHSFRHGFATSYLLAGGNLRELQERIGHDCIETTMGYLHCLPQNFDRIGSPWDAAPASPQILPFPKTA
ncbi:MAG: tyrosine-type recombinase/integrase [Verrucomicrobiota bacterium]